MRRGLVILVILLLVLAGVLASLPVGGVMRTAGGGADAADTADTADGGPEAAVADRDPGQQASRLRKNGSE